MAVKKQKQKKKNILSKLIYKTSNENGEWVFDPMSLSCDKVHLGEQMVVQTRFGVATYKI